MKWRERFLFSIFSLFLKKSTNFLTSTDTVHFTKTCLVIEKNWHALHVQLSMLVKKDDFDLRLSKSTSPQHQQRQQLWDLTAIAAGKNVYYTSSNTQKSKYRRQNSAIFCLQKQKKKHDKSAHLVFAKCMALSTYSPRSNWKREKIKINFPILFRGNASVVPTRFSALLVVTSSSLDGSPRQNCWASSKSPFSYKK